MRYLLLIYTREIDDAQIPAEERQRTTDAYNAFGREAGERKVMLGGEALSPDVDRHHRPGSKR